MWSLDQLAEIAGVSRRMLVNVEQGVTNPSVGILLRISDALGLGLPALVAPPKPSAVRVTRKGEGAVLWSGPDGGHGVLLGGTERPDILELWDWTLAPGERHVSEPHAAGTKEILHVHTGAITIDVGELAISLDGGDAVTFAGDVAHAYSNNSGAEAHYSLAVYEPGVGAHLRPEASHA